MEELVSVIMSTFKTANKYLKDSIDSILNQTYRNLELIIICDGAREDEEYITNNYDDERIKIIRHEQNEGLAKSLNDGIKLAKGKYIVRMDSDDISLKNRIKQQVNFMEKHPTVAVSSMLAKCFGDVNMKKMIVNQLPEEIEVELLYKNTLIHSSIIMRREYLIKNNILYNEEFRYSQDYELWSRIVNHNNIAIINRVGIKYRVHSQQVTVKKKDIQRALTDKVITRNSKKIKGKNSKDILFYLNGKEKITIENYQNVIKGISEIIQKNEYFDPKILRNVLYNRFFQLTISNKEIILKMLQNEEYREMIFTRKNFRYFINKIKEVVYMKNRRNYE